MMHIYQISEHQKFYLFKDNTGLLFGVKALVGYWYNYPL